MTQVIVHYYSIDGCNVVKSCETLEGARAWAMYWVGEHPTLGSCYAVSDDGIGKVMVTGSTIRKLFPEDAQYVFTVHTLDSHEHFGPFGSYKAAFDHAYGKMTFQIQAQRVDCYEA